MTESLQLPHCRACQRTFWYPRARCPHCQSDDIESLGSAGAGAVYSYSSMPAGKRAEDGRGDQILAYVELDEGPFVLATLAGLSLEEVEVGMRVVALPPNEAQPLQFGVPRQAGSGR